MDYLVVWTAAAAAASLSAPSGFGLGMLLMPAFVLFFPLDLAVAMAAMVHFFANILRTVSSVRSVDKNVLVRFGAPAILAAFLGARLLIVLLGLPPLLAYRVDDAIHYVQPVKAALALVIVLFVFFEVAPVFRKIAFGSHLMTLGGILSGFIAGFSGLQTSLRDAFLKGSGLPAADLMATGVVIGCLVDFSRISVYTAYFSDQSFGERGLLAAGAIICALLGAAAAERMDRTVVFPAVRAAVAAMLFGVAGLLVAGLV